MRRNDIVNETLKHSGSTCQPPLRRSTEIAGYFGERGYCPRGAPQRTHSQSSLRFDIFNRSIERSSPFKRFPPSRPCINARLPCDMDIGRRNRRRLCLGQSTRAAPPPVVPCRLFPPKGFLHESPYFSRVRSSPAFFCLMPTGHARRKRRPARDRLVYSLAHPADAALVCAFGADIFRPQRRPRRT